MKKSVLLVVFSALFFTTIVNAQWSRIKGNGKVVTEKRTTAGYDEIVLTGSFDVVLVSGTEGTISIEGEENIIFQVYFQ